MCCYLGLLHLFHLNMDKCIKKYTISSIILVFFLNAFDDLFHDKMTQHLNPVFWFRHLTCFPLKKKELHLTHSTWFSQCVKYDYQEIHNSFCQNSKAHRAGSTPTHECDDPLNLTLRKLWVCGVSNIFQSSIWMPSLLRNWGYEKKTKTRHHTRTVTTPS